MEVITVQHVTDRSTRSTRPSRPRLSLSWPMSSVSVANFFGNVASLAVDSGAMDLPEVQLPIDQLLPISPLQQVLVLGAYTLMIAGASLIGGWLPGRLKLSHLQFQLVLSLIGGLLLGLGIFHLLSHAIQELGDASRDVAMAWMMVGIVFMFFLLRTLHVHHHEPDTAPVSDLPTNHVHEHDHDHDHGHCDHDHEEFGIGWVGLVFGLAIHTILDGVALGAAMQSDALHGVKYLVGFGVLIAIVLHKPLDSFSITTLMMKAKCSAALRWGINIGYSLLCPLGAAIFLWGIWNLTSETQYVVGCSLAFSAGVFVCISLADLLPEMEFHAHHRWQLSIMLVLGILLAWGIRYLEPAHIH